MADSIEIDDEQLEFLFSVWNALFEQNESMELISLMYLDIKNFLLNVICWMHLCGAPLEQDFPGFI